jgi:hypothetical protein
MMLDVEFGKEVVPTWAGARMQIVLNYYRVRARDARIRVMHAEHHLSDLKFEAA